MFDPETAVFLRPDQIPKRERESDLVKELLDAAFRELQHDTGETELEWHHSRNVLAKKFATILSRHKRRK
jgi:hypothetical protein